MNFFYLRHHYQSIIRSTSFDGEVFAFFILAILFGSSISLTYDQLDLYAETISSFFSQNGTNYFLFLLVYLFLDLVIRLVFRRPLPKLKYYVLWSNASKEIASQYLVTSLFGIVPFILLISALTIAFKANEWLGTSAMLSVILWWLANHFVGLISQFANKRVKPIIALVMMLVLLAKWLLPSLGIEEQLMNLVVSVGLLLVSVIIAFLMVRRAIEAREVSEENGKSGLLESLPVLSFKNPVFQLEWALLVRNKRTRSNLLLGLLSVLILPFLLDGETEWMIGTLIFFITTGFFIIQHGVYSLGWEGSYFDFLITNISPKAFIKTRYIFYVGTCIIGLLLASISTVINGLSWASLFMLFLYNVGVTIPLVLYRSTLNSTKIILTENSFMNYNGMMTGPIFVSSFLVTLLPLFIYGLGQAIMGQNAIYLLGLMGVVGLLAFKPLTDLIAKKYHSRKYHLSQSFKA
ncbi:DUF5687 family protein [Ekhidna sp. To15]|uniref:DUF5687 family protein n=1 Tax=Ekhidna sp. To15 TaxID=3395267 RepID=UPI003F51CE4B